MRLGTYTAITLLAVVAMGAAAGTVAAKPSTENRETARSGLERGVAYRTELADFDHTVTTSVDGGGFELSADSAKVVLTSDGGDVIAEVPLTFEISGKRLELAEQISDDGEKLTLTPRTTAKEIGELRSVGSMDRLVAELDRNMAALVIGGILGGIIGAAVGLMFFSIITGPIGMIVGAIAAGYIMGGQPFADAVTSVLTGQP